MPQKHVPAFILSKRRPATHPAVHSASTIQAAHHERFGLRLPRLVAQPLAMARPRAAPVLLAGRPLLGSMPRQPSVGGQQACWLARRHLAAAGNNTAPCVVVTAHVLKDYGACGLGCQFPGRSSRVNACCGTPLRIL